MLLYSNTPYRLPKDVVKRQVQVLKGMGITFEVGVEVEKDVPLTEIKTALTLSLWQEEPGGA